ncbi:MAG: class I SAM-dependent methyltransferase [Bryobacteraceae bacterium]|jgi:methyltransferase (TIGR00027 family)
MPSGGDQILHVSDTAVMVAACRAVETARPDGLVRDPFAERLAGARGMAILRGVPGWRLMCFGVGIRSRFVDDLVNQTVAEQGIGTVLSVGAGLDTRPWRLDLPPDLRWIEVDFPDVIGHKAAAMAPEKPKCRLEHVAADLAGASERQAVFEAAGAAPGLMITEGLLLYLPARTVEAIAAESAALSGIRYWLLDASSLNLARRMGLDSRKSIQNVRAPGHLVGLQVLEAVRRHGWTQMRFRSYTRDSMEVAAGRIRAAVESFAAAGTPLPAPPPDDRSGVYLFRHL